MENTDWMRNSKYVQSMPGVRIRFVVLLAFIWMNILHAVTAARQEPSPQLKRLTASCTDAKDCPVSYNKEDLKKTLTPLQYRVTQEKGTERAFTGKYVKNKDEGLYTCVVCGNQLFSSDNKYDSQSGWPSFYDTVSQKHIRLTEDNSHGMQRIEVTCSNCGSHLGHVFRDGPEPTYLRYCINSAALNFSPKIKKVKSGL